MTLSPKILINIAVLAAAVLAFLIFSVMLSAPYTGFMLDDDEENGSFRVVKVDSWIEEQGLQLGDVVQRISNDEGLSIEVERKHLLRSSQEARDSYANRSERLTEVDRMYRLLSTGTLVVTRADGSETTLQLDRRRPISSLSLTFWALFFFSLTAPLVGAIVWAWQPKRPEATLLLISGLGYFASCYSSLLSIYNTDMLYLPLTLHMFIRIGLDLGQLTFVVFGTAVLLYYPHRLSFAPAAIKVLIVAYLIYPFFALFHGWSFSDLERGIYPAFTDTEAYSPMLAMFLLTMTLCWFQFRASRQRPVQRAQTLWIILAWTLGPGIFVSLYMLPRWLGLQPIMQGSVFLQFTILSTYLMILLGTARTNLFHLEQYIGQAYQWVIMSMLFIGLDITLISLVNFSPEISSAIVLIAVIWIYIPIRQWIKTRLSADRRGQSEALTSEAVVLMVRNSLDPKSTPRDCWSQVVGSLFRPGATRALESSEKSSIGMRGQQLIVSGNDYSPALQLDFADGGSRLFAKRDVALAETMSVLFEKLYDVRDSFLEGQTQERNRIRRDLHDQIGHKLLSLIYSAGDEKSRSLAQETMTQLSELIQALKQKPIALDDLAARMHGVCDDICTSANLTLEWRNNIPIESMALIASDQFLNILNILRELLSNTIKHAGAGHVLVSLDYDDAAITLLYTDDGKGFEQSAIKPGNGLYNLQARAKELDAKMEWDTTNGTSFKLVIPVDAGESKHE